MSIAKVTLALAATATVALFAGCSGNTASQNSRSIPNLGGRNQASSAQHHISYLQRWSYPASVIPPELRPTETSLSKLHQLQTGTRLISGTSFTMGIYASEFEGIDIFGYAVPNISNNPPSCKVPSVSYPNDIFVDPKGNLVDPDGGTGTVIVFKGPTGCGAKLGSFTDPFGQPSDAATVDAATDTIAVANIFDTNGNPGSISVCTLSGPINCPTNLTNSGMYEVYGVAMDGYGNCYASAVNASSVPTLTYFAGCAGPGVAATGYLNSAPGGLDIDAFGNLVSIDASGQLYVYSGCQPACSLVGGPLPMHSGETIFGHLQNGSPRNRTQFAAANVSNGAVDVYTYTPTSLTYQYSFNNGLSQSLGVVGAAFLPAQYPPETPPKVDYPTEIVNYWAKNPTTTPTDIDLVFNGDVRTALDQELPLFGIYDAFCAPSQTCSPTIMYDSTTNQTTFTLSGTQLYPNSYYTTQSHFALLYGTADIPSLPCPEAGAQWSFASGSPQPVAWASMNYFGCVPPSEPGPPPTQYNHYWIVYFETSFAPITTNNPATSGQWFELPATNGKIQPAFKFANYGTAKIYTANAGIYSAGLAPLSPDCQQNQACPENLNLLAALNYTVYKPPYFPGTKFQKMRHPPPPFLLPLGGSKQP